MTRIYFNEKSIVITDRFDSFEKKEPPFYITSGNDEEKISEALNKIADHHQIVIIDDNPAKILEAFRKKFKFIQAAGGFVHDKQQVLFIFRKGKWDLPKGKLDEGESLEVCAVREVEEETGLKNINLEKPIMFTYHSYTENQKTILKETHWFLMKADSALPLSPQAEEGIEKCIWTDVLDLNSYLDETYPLVKDVVRKAMALI
jgi:8-oxo-dGTP pyrophosphatase MutT (NUDIX family)